jgi:hypothetical protein
MGWKNRMTFRGKRHVEHEVEGQTFNFYPNRIALLQEAAELSQPVADAIMTLMNGPKDSDSGSKFVRQQDGDFVREDTEASAPTIEVLEYRRKERSDAIKQVFDALGDPRSRLLLGKLLMDSLREEFKFSNERSTSEIEEFMYGDGEEYAGLDTPVLFSFLTGWMKANARVFGKSGESLVGLVKKKLDNLQVESLLEEEPTGTAPTNGSSSKTPSSQP